MGGKKICALGCLATTLVLVTFQPAPAEDVLFIPDFGQPPEPINPGDTIYFFVKLFGNATPITGYSLNVDSNPAAFTMGSVIGNAGLSTFYESENVIAQGGGQLHPISSIFDPGDDGLFVNAITLDAVPVDLAGPGHDVLAWLAFDVSLDALGEFTLSIGPASVLVDEEFDEIPFTWDPITFEVVPIPEPSVVAFAVFGIGLWTGCRRTGNVAKLR